MARYQVTWLTGGSYDGVENFFTDAETPRKAVEMLLSSELWKEVAPEGYVCEYDGSFYPRVESVVEVRSIPKEEWDF